MIQQGIPTRSDVLTDQFFYLAVGNDGKLIPTEIKRKLIQRKSSKIKNNCFCVFNKKLALNGFKINMKPKILNAISFGTHKSAIEQVYSYFRGKLQKWLRNVIYQVQKHCLH